LALRESFFEKSWPKSQKRREVRVRKRKRLTLGKLKKSLVKGRTKIGSKKIKTDNKNLEIFKKILVILNILN